MVKKVLVIRFNSIGDIVLTSPTIRALAKNGYEVHYLVKHVFATLLKTNPFVTKIWTLKDDLNFVIHNLKTENFDFIIDLHNNLRSVRVKSALGVKSYTLHKPRLKYWLLTNFGVNIKPEPHIVRRFLNVAEPLTGKIESPNLEFYFDNKVTGRLISDLPPNYICIAIGAAFKTKMILTNKLVEIINSINDDVVLIGGKVDMDRAMTITEKVNRRVINLVGKISISDSAHVISNCHALLSGDTGMMHIGAALNVKMVNVFGSTHPILGYLPFYGSDSDKSTIVQVEDLKCRPCTKQGRYECPKGHFKCMNKN